MCIFVTVLSTIFFFQTVFQTQLNSLLRPETSASYLDHLLSFPVTYELFFKSLCFPSLGVPSDPTFHPDLHSCWSYETNHSAYPEPATAAIWTEELRVHIPHPGQHASCASAEVQQYQHTVSEDRGKA